MAVAHDHDTEVTEAFQELYREQYEQEVYDLARSYPNDRRSLVIEYDDLFRFDSQLADNLLDRPKKVLEYADEALRLYDVPVDVDLGNAHVRVVGLPETQRFYPGEFSPTDQSGSFRAIRAEVAMATDVYPRITQAAFECQRCGTLTHIPQQRGDYKEAQECQGCERQGPFEVNKDQSEFVDWQLLRLQTPPEVSTGSAKDLDVIVEDDMVGVAEMGDRVTANGQLRLKENSSDGDLSGTFEPWLDANHVELEESDKTELEISPEDRTRIKELANGAEGDPLDVAADSLAPTIHGHAEKKRALIVSAVGGVRVQYSSGKTDRGDIHVLLLGDPGTAKSELLERMNELIPRSVGVSAMNATEAGLLATAEQNDFGAGEWSLKPGAFVKANGSVVTIDELDDMASDVRASLLEPMANQRVNVSKAGINTQLATEAGVVAAANPKYGRFDPYENIVEQFVFEDNLLSRFDLIFTFKDRPDEETDGEIAGHILSTSDAAKRANRSDLTVDKSDEELINPAVEPEILRKWIMLAKQQPDPVFESDAVEEKLKEEFTALRGMYGYDDPTAPVPVTFRKLEAIRRIAEAIARFEFSDVITERHAELTTKMVGKSMQDYAKDADGNLDADIVETGSSASQRERRKSIGEVAVELQSEYEGGAVPRDDIVERAAEECGGDESMIDSDITTMKSEGEFSEPATGKLRYLGR